MRQQTNEERGAPTPTRPRDGGGRFAVSGRTWTRLAAWVAAACVAILAIAACSGSSGNGGITIFAAASLTDAFDELAKEFERRNDGVEVRLSYQGSSTLRIQLEQGASADVFASADEFNMDLAVEAGLIASDPTIFARNRLAIIVRRDSTAVAGLDDLSKAGLRLVIGADVVPVGRYTSAALDRLAADPAFGPAYRDQVEANIASKEANVRRAVAKVELGEADAAIGYVTDAEGVGRDDLIAILIPERYTDSILYPIGTVRDAPSPGLAEQFIAFVTSDEGQRILIRHEFLPPEDAS